MLAFSTGFQTRPACQLKNWLSSLILLRPVAESVLATVSKVS